MSAHPEHKTRWVSDCRAVPHPPILSCPAVSCIFEVLSDTTEVAVEAFVVSREKVVVTMSRVKLKSC